MNNTRPRLRRMLALAAALAFGLAGFAQSARADDPVPPSNIDANRKATLTVHKCVQPETPGNAASGSDLGNACDPINGVEFTLYRVGSHDLTTAQGWEDIKGITAPESGSSIPGQTTTPVSAQTTSGTGTASWSNLPLGLYLVVETNTGAPDTRVVLGSKPFLVTLPYVTNNAWNYDVHVYPKNSVAGITKTVTDDQATAGYLGRGVTWTLTSDIPLAGQGVNVTSYVITDTLPAGLNVQSYELKISDVNVPITTAEATCTPAGTATQDGTLTCTFTSTGLTLLNQHPGKKVVLTLVTDVTDAALGVSGVFTNSAKVTINGNDSASSQASTTWGRLRVFKFDQSNSGPLAGASFQLCAEANCATVVASGLTTNTAGIVELPTLRVGTYYLVETAAPAGYQLNATPIQVEVTAGGTTVSAQPTVKDGSTNYQPVPNTKQNTPQLPLTGGIGQLALMAGGVGMLVIAGAIMVIGRLGARRKS